MKTLLLLAVIMVFGLLQAHGDLLNFRKMIKLATGKEATTSYGFYGCHCGVGGKGSPKDATDRCCFAHDCCYKRLERRGCGTKFLSYKFSNKGSSITCEDSLRGTGALETSGSGAEKAIAIMQARGSNSLT
uniref:Phospholipase A2 n=1 Tax=Callithrix jacchus TaxID=9483 RepID=F7GTB5_CALJA